MATIEAVKSEGSPTGYDPTPYDAVPYPSYPFPQTHPARLATVATFFGMTPANVECCRVLEIGCASGGNLIPMADILPESRFLGIDLSERQIKEGQATISAVGLTNIELRCLDLLDVTDDLGQFDYIICHGVYSWVPPAVQAKILAICKSHLAPQGVAYVSYNTLPGWNMRRTIRDLMCFHAAKMADPRRRIGEARKFLDFMAQHAPTDKNPYGMLIKTEVERMRKQSDAYLLHEHMEETNSPCYFHEFASAASLHGLQYLGEAEVQTMMLSNMGPEIAPVLRQFAGDIIEMEQYMDFMRNRSFWQTLLCHEEVNIRRSIGAESVLDAFISTRLAPKSQENSTNVGSATEFASPDGRAITSKADLLTAALLEMNVDHPCAPMNCGDGTERATEAPTPLRFADLYDRACSRLAGNSVHDSSRDAHQRLHLAAEFLRLYVMGLVEITVWSPTCTTGVPAFPCGTALARHRATVSSAVTNVYHQLVPLSDLDRQVLRFCDGQNSIEDLMTKLAEESVGGRLVIRQAGKCINDVSEAQRVLGHLLPSAVQRLARRGMLVSEKLTSNNSPVPPYVPDA